MSIIVYHLFPSVNSFSKFCESYGFKFGYFSISFEKMTSYTEILTRKKPYHITFLLVNIRECRK